MFSRYSYGHRFPADRGEFFIKIFGAAPYQGGVLLIDPRWKSEKVSVGSLQGRGRVGVPLGYCLPEPKNPQATGAALGGRGRSTQTGDNPAGAPQGQVVDGNAGPGEGRTKHPISRPLSSSFTFDLLLPSQTTL